LRTSGIFGIVAVKNLSTALEKCFFEHPYGLIKPERLTKNQQSLR
jgi:hypothetical protein